MLEFNHTGTEWCNVCWASQ